MNFKSVILYLYNLFKNNNSSKNLLLVTSIIMMLLSLIIQKPMILFYSVILIWFQIIIFSLQSIHNRSALICFEIAFFVFLLGRTFIAYIDIGHTLDNYDIKINMHTYFLLYISQLSIYLSYKYIEKKKLKNKIIKSNMNNIKFIHYIRIASILIMVITLIPYLWNIYDKIDFVSNNSYEELYLKNSSNIPSFIFKASQFFVPAFFIYLGTMPSKSKAIVPIIIYLGASLWSIKTGARAGFARPVMVIFFYFLARDKFVNEGEKRWIGKKEIITAIVLIPIMIMFLYNIGNIRYGNSVESFSIIESIKNFFIEQGISIKVIKHAKLYQDKLPNNLYVLGPIIDIFKENFIVNSIFDFKTHGKQTVEQALYGNKFSDALSYLVMRRKYLLGYGLGSSYIAEAYHNYSYIGVSLMNIFYGFIFQLIDRSYGKNYWITGISLYMLYYLVYAPRNIALSFISGVFNITNIFIFIVIYIIAKFLYRYFIANKLTNNKEI